MSAPDEIPFDHTSAVTPLFLDDGRNLQQFGSGVFVILGEAHFVLTAAHVGDLTAHGAICMPAESGIVPICGTYGHVQIPRNVSRNKDKYDVAYVRLTEEFANNVDRAIRPLTLRDLRLQESLMEDDVYTFSGYPMSKGKSRADRCFSEIFSYTGAAASISKYQRMGYDQDDHILVNFNRKRSIDSEGKQQMPPHPRGISGGGVFAWPKDVFEKSDPDFRRYLVGIGHTYLKQAHCLIGTRINVFLTLIVANHHDIAAEFSVDEGDQQAEIPQYLTMVWYRKEDWPQLMNDFDDAEKYHASWSQWRQTFENGLEELGRRGMHPVPVEITRDEIVDHCKNHRQPNTSETRLALASKKFVDAIRERDL